MALVSPSAPVATTPAGVGLPTQPGGSRYHMLMTRRPTATWHGLAVSQAAEQLHVDPTTGLASAEAARRLVDTGPNTLLERGARGRWPILREQLTSLLVIILIVAAAISAALGDLLDAVVILFIVLANALFGFFQEYRAERAIAALKQ